MEHIHRRMATPERIYFVAPTGCLVRQMDNGAWASAEYVADVADARWIVSPVAGAADSADAAVAAFEFYHRKAS